MSTIRITKRAVDSIPNTAEGQQFYRDNQLAGFGVRVGTKSKVYFVEGRVNARTQRVTIGRADVLCPEVARKKAIHVLSQMASGEDPNGLKRKQKSEQISVEAAFVSFFSARGSLTKGTLKSYERTMSLYLADWRDTPVRQLSRQMVLKRHQQIADERGEVTANNVMRHLRSVLNFVAATQDDFPPNPVQILTQARAWYREKRRRTLVASQDLPMWWKAVMAEPPHARDFLIVALLTGMRRNEVACLRWENIDFDKRALHLPRTKNGDPLDLPLSDYLYERLVMRKTIFGNSPWVFPGGGASGHLVETKRIIDRVSLRANIKFTMHDLRRTFITLAEGLDIPHYALKRMLNHRAGSDVTGGYIVIDIERLRKPVERVNATILELAGALNE